jgi:hypothetical protein
MCGTYHRIPVHRHHTVLPTMFSTCPSARVTCTFFLPSTALKMLSRGIHDIIRNFLDLSFYRKGLQAPLHPSVLWIVHESSVGEIECTLAVYVLCLSLDRKPDTRLSIFNPARRSNETSRQEAAYLQRPINLTRMLLLAVYPCVLF